VLLVDHPREMGEDVGLAGDPELSSELLPGRGNVTLTPSPLPVREGLVYQVSNHEVMDCSEHQIRLSKGVIAKFVQPLELEVCRRTAPTIHPYFLEIQKATAMVAFVFLSSAGG
jgi:hypothetical protein